MNAQHTADNILIDLDSESQRDLLSDAGTTPARIASFHRHDGFDEVFLGSFRARAMPVLGRKQQAILSFAQRTVEMQQSGRLQNDGVTDRDNLPLRARLFSGWFLKFFPASAVRGYSPA